MSEKKEQQEIYYFGYFKKLYESWEESTNKMMDVWMSSPFMDRAVEKSSEFKNYIHDFIDKTLEKRYVPQNRDLKRIIDTLDSLEAKVAELEEKIEELKSEHKKPSRERRAKVTKQKVREKKQ